MWCCYKVPTSCIIFLKPCMIVSLVIKYVLGKGCAQVASLDSISWLNRIATTSFLWRDWLGQINYRLKSLWLPSNERFFWEMLRVRRRPCARYGFTSPHWSYPTWVSGLRSISAEEERYLDSTCVLGSNASCKTDKLLWHSRFFLGIKLWERFDWLQMRLSQTEGVTMRS